MHALAPHRARVFGSPWNGVYATRIESGRHFGKHWHAAYGFGFLERGAHRSASGRGSVDAYAGDLITTNPGEVHDGRPLGGPSRRWCIVYVDPALMGSMESGGHAQITRPVIKDSLLSAPLQRLFRRLERWNSPRRADAAEALACEESLVETCALLLARHGTLPLPAEAPGDVRRVRDRLADDPLAPPALSELAAIAGLSKFQLLRRFQRAFGVPPHAWLLQQRAERARALIAEGSSLAAAAACSGFSDQSHMTRIFVRHFGFTPGAWRKARLQ
jgi:AraC-like DNA-binding protein